MKNLIIAFAFLIGVVSCLEFDRPCREDVPAKENFLKAAYTGIWYELQRSDDLGADCLIHHYTARGNVTFDVARDGRFQGTAVRETGTASIAFPNEENFRAKFNATIDRIIGGPILYNYQVYATDYSNYAITWTCQNLPEGRSREEGAVLGRSTQLSGSVNSKVTFLLSEIGLNREDFRYIDHSLQTCFGLTQNNV